MVIKRTRKTRPCISVNNVSSEERIESQKEKSEEDIQMKKTWNFTD